MTTPDPAHGTRADDPLDEPMAQLYARDPSLWQILVAVRAQLSKHSGELRLYAGLILLTSGSQNDYVKAALHLAAARVHDVVIGMMR